MSVVHYEKIYLTFNPQNYVTLVPLDGFTILRENCEAVVLFYLKRYLSFEACSGKIDTPMFGYSEQNLLLCLSFI